MIEVANKAMLDKYEDDDLVWYACYGSNIKLDRLMLYIRGDEKCELAEPGGCRDKNAPVEMRPYVFSAPIYFARCSDRWGKGGGGAFLDYGRKGRSYGRIYKMKKSQFEDVFRQESRYYDTMLYLGECDGAPIFSFSNKKKGVLTPPSERYHKVIKEGLLETFEDMNEREVEEYLERMINESK